MLATLVNNDKFKWDSTVLSNDKKAKLEVENRGEEHDFEREDRHNIRVFNRHELGHPTGSK